MVAVRGAFETASGTLRDECAKQVAAERERVEAEVRAQVRDEAERRGWDIAFQDGG